MLQICYLFWNKKNILSSLTQLIKFIIYFRQNDKIIYKISIFAL